MIDIEEELKRCIVSTKWSLGGQHTNGPNPRIRLTHPEFGFEVMVDQYRYVYENKELAEMCMRMLLTTLRFTLPSKTSI